jgi:hypothetical protein
VIGRRTDRRLWVVVAAALAVSPVLAQPQVADLRAREVLGSPAFLANHPDMRYRQLGHQAQVAGRMSEARSHFQAAARYADKLSQAALAEMWWSGQGGALDRAMGYAWMDLAAERGTPFLLAQRERYWAALDPDERQRAVSEGRTLYAEFGDPAAQPRLERELRSGLRTVTGSRTGAVTAKMDMFVRDKRGARVVDPDTFYQDAYWQPTRYWQWKAEELAQAGRGNGTVDVGAPTTVPGPAD